MENIVTTALTGLFFGTFGTTLGGLLGVSFKKGSQKFLSFILSFASGLMLSVVCFDLIPESMEITSVSHTLLGILCGVIIMMLSEAIIDQKLRHVSNQFYANNQLLKTGVVVGIGLALHNLPEGLAIGAGLESSLKLGYSLAIAICLHDIPEGISMSVPMKNGGMCKKKVILYVLLSGVTTGIGAMIGSMVGCISSTVIAFCLAFAGGAMLYIVSGELIPESNKLYQGRLPVLGNLLGFILGIFVTKI